MSKTPSGFLVGVAIALVPVAVGLWLYRTMKSPEPGGIDTLRIDAAGVRFTRDGVAHDFAWPDIARTREIVLENNTRGGPVMGVQIQVKGRLYGPDEHLDYLKPLRFGFSDAEFQSLIKAGIARWGDGAANHADGQAAA